MRLVVTNRARGGVTFEGTDGTVWVNRGAIESKPDGLVYQDIGPTEIHLPSNDGHFRNFIDCVLSRKEPIAPIEQAHRSITYRASWQHIAAHRPKNTLGSEDGADHRR